MEKTLTKAIKTICCSLTGVLTISGTPQQLYAENASLPYSDCISKPGSTEVGFYDLC